MAVNYPLPDSGQISDALARRIAETGAAEYDPDGMYTGGKPAIVFGAMPAQPDDVIVIGIYGDDRDRTDRSPVIAVQLRYRTAGRDPRATDTLADTVFAALHAETNVTWHGIRVLQSRRTIRAPLGADDNGRYERADSYHLILNPIGDNHG